MAWIPDKSEIVKLGQKIKPSYMLLRRNPLFLINIFLLIYSWFLLTCICCRSWGCRVRYDLATEELQQLLLYNVLISVLQQRDLVILIHIYTLLFKIFFFIMIYRRMLSIVFCAIQQDLLLTHSTYKSLHLLTPISRSIPPLSPLLLGSQKSVLYVCDSVSVS